MLNHRIEVAAIIWFAIDSGGQYRVLIFMDFGIQESDAGFGIREFKIVEYFSLILPINSISSNSIPPHKKMSSINPQ